MTPFLLQIAEAYLKDKRDSLIDYHFVFPNKRAVTFFSNYLTRESGGEIILPQCWDIDTLVMDLTQSVVPSHTEQLLILFNCYKEIVTEAGGETDLLSLDAFIPWGEMVLNDFNDIDLYLASPEEIFRNLKHFKEISSNFLNEEQVAVIESYWGNEFLEYWNDDRLWQHINYEEKNKDSIRNFFRLWMLMYPLYLRFNKVLGKRGKRYSGNAYRKLARILKTDDPFNSPKFNNAHFVFVGFNQLALSQEKLFEHLDSKGNAAFWWDDSSFVFKATDNPCVRKVREYKKRFRGDKSVTYDFEVHISDSLPEIEIIGVPSHYSEVKKGAQILEHLLKKYPEEFEGIRARDTAYIVPEEILVLPLIDSIPEYKNPDLPPEQKNLDSNKLKVNITMAYPLRDSPFYSLFILIVRLYKHARFQDGNTFFYFKDVIALFSHPALRTSYPQLCLDTVTRINTERRFEVKQSDLIKENEPIAQLFPAISNELYENQFDLVRAQLLVLRGIFPQDSIESAFASSFLRGLDTLNRLCDEQELVLSYFTILNQLNKVVSADSVHFAGEPLEGVQVMGLLETRALDFENIILLGANERVFPRKQTFRSFIPMAMRNDYGLPTSDTSDSVYAYYFYRLIGRARRVFMIYDARGGSGGEMSRYIYQLLYIYGKLPESKIRHHIDYYPLNSTENPSISVKKDVPWIQEALQRLTVPGSKENLSASSLKDYLECPLKFFLKKIAKYDIDDDLKEYIEESGYGTIIHSILEHLYGIESENNPSFFAKDINIIRKTKKSLIVREAVRAIRKIVYGLSEKESGNIPDFQLTPESLGGEYTILATIITEIIDNILAAEAEFDSIEYFNYIAGEKEIVDNIEFAPGLKVNVRGFIDRIDRVKLPDNPTPVLRFIDYKTGNEPVKISSEDALFYAEDKNWPKGLFQLLFYCDVYSIQNGLDEPIIPQIYPIRKIKSTKLSFSSYGLKDDNGRTKFAPLTDHRVFGHFHEKVSALITEIFNKEIPFTNRPGDIACKYCKFKSICNK